MIGKQRKSYHNHAIRLFITEN